MKKPLFLSTVTSEFGSVRVDLADHFNRLNCGIDVHHQEGFFHSGTGTLQVLEKHVKDCSTVIHVIGKIPGWIPPPDQVTQFLTDNPTFESRFPDIAKDARLGKISATQWEAWLGAFFGKKLHSYSFPDHLIDGSPQKLHADRLAAASHFPKPVKTERTLHLEILGSLHDDGWLTQEQISTAVSPKKNTKLIKLAESVRKLISEMDHGTKDQTPVFPVRVRNLNEATNDKELKILLHENESLLPLFTNNSKKLMLVGERGTGKTFTMFQLIKQLAQQTIDDKSAAVPLLFNLSSWNDTYQQAGGIFARFLSSSGQMSKSNTLDSWLEDQIVRNYSMQRNAAKDLLENNHIIICLDGLDELGEIDRDDNTKSSLAAKTLRDACVRAINGTLSHDNSVQMIVCCRDDTYSELSVKPDISNPLRTERLSRAEVIESLKSWTTHSGLSQAIAESDQLAERAEIHLFLSMMYIAYQQMPKRAILEAAKKPMDQWEKHLFDHYVDHCIKNASDTQTVNKRLIEQFLSWMARQPDNDLLLDNLQPSVLRLDESPEGIQLWKHYRRSSIFFLSFILALAESTGPTLIIGTGYFFNDGLAAGLLRAVITFLSSMVLLLALYIPAFRSRNWLTFGLLLGISWSFECALMVFLTHADKRAESNNGTWAGAESMFLTSLPLACAFFTLVGFYLFGRLTHHRNRYKSKPGIQWYEIVPMESRDWRWKGDKSLWQGGWIGLLAAPLVLLITWFGGQFGRGLVYAPILTLMVCLYSGWAGTGTARISIVPNQGIDRSLRNGLQMMGLFIVFTFFTVLSIYWMKYGWEHAVSGAFGSLSVAFAFYIFGGIPVIRQFCLGFILHRNGKLPSWFCWPPWKKTVEFLNQLVHFDLLRRSAGGYMFRHQSFKNYYLQRSQQR